MLRFRPLALGLLAACALASAAHAAAHTPEPLITVTSAGLPSQRTVNRISVCKDILFSGSVGGRLAATSSMNMFAQRKWIAR